MKQIENQQMIDFLQNSDSWLYIDLLATLRRTNLQSTLFYLSRNDFVVAINYFGSNTDYYFNVSCEGNIKFLCELVKNKKTETEYVQLYSYSESIYETPLFVEYFGVCEHFADKQYGLFIPIKHQIVLPETDKIRQLTVDDCDMAEKFSVSNEQHGLPSWELPNFIDYGLKTGSENHRIYGYFRNNIMVGFLTIASVSENFWHVAYIYTSPEYWQNGIALNLAKHFINEFIDKDAFISYGTAITEASKKTALAAGFELFSVTYRLVHLNIN